MLCCGKYLDVRGTRYQGTGENYITSSGDEIKKNEIGGASSKYGRVERCVQGFGGDN
jgi:hypothetical protein